MAYDSTRDILQRLNKDVRLEVVEASCVYPETLSMKEHRQRAYVESTYKDLETFTAAVNAAKRDPHIKRLGFSLSIPIILDSLVELFETVSSESLYFPWCRPIK
jgi:hypothetical protein